MKGRIVPVVLEVTESDADLLHETTDQFREAATNVDCDLLRWSYKASVGDEPGGVRVTPGMLNTSGFAPALTLGSVGVHGERLTQ